MNIPRLCEAHRGFLVLQSAHESIGGIRRSTMSVFECGTNRPAGLGSALPAYHVNSIVRIFTRHYNTARMVERRSRNRFMQEGCNFVETMLTITRFYRKLQKRPLITLRRNLGHRCSHGGGCWKVKLVNQKGLVRPLLWMQSTLQVGNVTDRTYLISVPYPFLSSNVLSFMATNESKADPLTAYTGYSFADDQSYQVSLSLS